MDPARDHTHEWRPMDGESGRYTCACGQTGYRKHAEIVPHKQVKKVKGPPLHIGAPNLSGGNARRGKRGPGSW